MARRETGELDRGRPLLQRCIALSPNLQAPYFDLGILFLRSGQVEKGIGQLEAALNLPAPTGPIPDLDVVVSELRRVLSAKPELAEGHNILGLLLGKQGADPKQVMSAFREAIRLRPDYAEAHNNLGLVLVQVGDSEKGILEFREALRLAPEYVSATGNLGAALVGSQPVEAIGLLEKAVAMQPSFVRAQYNLALAYAQSSEHGLDKAIAQFEKVIELDPGFAAAHFELGKVLLRKNALPQAILSFQEALKLDPKLGAARYQLGLALTRAGKPAEGAAELEKARVAIEEESKQGTASQLLAEARAAKEAGQYDTAIEALRKLSRLLPLWPGAYYELGLALLAKGDSIAAKASFEKALEVDPQYVPARESLQRAAGQDPSPPQPKAQRATLVASPGLGMTALADDPETVKRFEDYIRQQRFAELEPLVRDYLQSNPDSWWGHYVLGYTLFGQQRIGDSITALAKSLQLNLKNADAHRLLGRNLMLIGRFDVAQTELEQAVKLSPQRAEIRYDLGKIHSAQDNYPPAKRELEEAIRLDPSYMEAYDALGFVMESMGDDSAALANYRKSAELSETRGAGFVSPYVNLATHYNRLGDSKLAAEHARKALRLNPKSDAANFQLAKALDREQEWPKAAEALEAAIAVNPRASAYRYLLSGVYRRLGKTKESEAQMEVFRRLEKEAAEFEQKRRETRRNQPHQTNR
jgi:tetratricopeptide (TPR) repeat protein